MKKRWKIVHRNEFYRRSEDGMSITGSAPYIASEDGAMLHPHVYGRSDEEINRVLDLTVAALNRSEP